MKLTIRDYAICYSIERSKERNQLFFEAIRKIQSIEAISKQNLTVQLLEELEQNVKIEIEYNEYKRAGAMLCAKLPNFDQNEADISYISRIEKLRGDSNIIYSLTDNDGNMCEGTEHVLPVVEDFYSSLYTRDPEDVNEQNFFFRNINTRLENSKKLYIDRPFTVEELFEALSDLKPNKSPGDDCFTKEFYAFFWVYIIPIHAGHP